MRTAYKVRAYPSPGQAVMLARTFGCVRGVWNRTLADRGAVSGSSTPAISETGWGQFRQFLTYKAQRAGRRLVVVDRWYPSSKTCSACGYLLAALSLGVRRWLCPDCGTRHDRDLNAAKNILAAGLAAGP